MAQPHSSWHALNKVLHGLSWLKLVFYAAGLYYQYRTMTHMRGRSFKEDLCFTLMMYGFSLAFEGLRDNTAVTPKAADFFRAHASWIRWAIFFLIVFCTLVCLLGLVALLVFKDTLQGVAIATFGLGMLTLLRLEYDRLNHVVGT